MTTRFLRNSATLSTNFYLVRVQSPVGEDRLLLLILFFILFLYIVNFL